MPARRGHSRHLCTGQLTQTRSASRTCSSALLMAVALASAIVQIWSASTGAGEQRCDPADLRHAGGDRKGPGRPDAGLILPGGTQPQEDHRHPHAQEPSDRDRRRWCCPRGWSGTPPEVLVSGTSHRPSAPSSPPESPSFGVVGQGRADQAELTHPRLLSLVSDPRAGCGVRREAASEGRHFLKASTPGVSAGFRCCDVTNSLKYLGGDAGDVCRQGSGRSVLPPSARLVAGKRCIHKVKSCRG
jgi:hypothetical protein